MNISTTVRAPTGLMLAINQSAASVRQLMNAMCDTPHARLIAEIAKLRQKACGITHPFQMEVKK